MITLGSLYFFQGLALAVLPNPGGGTSEGFRWLFTGSPRGIGSNPYPAAILISVVILIVAWWMAKTRSGLSLYAVGSDKTAAYLSGIRAARVKIVSYAVGGRPRSHGRPGDHGHCRSGQRHHRRRQRHPELGCGHRARRGGPTGGIGSVIAVVPAGLILFFLNPILTAMGVDPNRAQIVQGVLIVVVMMVTGLIEWRRRRRV